MRIIYLILSVTSCYAAVEFSTRPTNVSLLLLHFTSQAVNRPVILGSFGLWSLMAGLSYGAIGDTTREIFRGFLLLTDQNKFNAQYKNLTDILFKTDMTGVSVSNKNYFFMDKDFIVLPDFQNMLEKDYDTTFRGLNFRGPNAADTANNLIKRLSPPVTNVFNPDDFKGPSVIMSNVLFFKGEWSLPFNASNTVQESVSSFQGKPGRVNMMHMRGKVPYSHMESMKASVMELSYGNGDKYCMLLLLPDQNVSVNEVYKSFEKITFNDIFAKLQSDINESGLKEIDVKLPRFAKRSKLQLHKPFNDMGIYDAFEPIYAKFAYMGREPIYIETIEHNAMITITESGTVAYATTPGINAATPNFEENEAMPPLIYFIIEKTTLTVIFGGIFN